MSLAHLGVLAAATPVPAPKPASEPIEPGLLIIGNQISFYGEIGACKRLVVEGNAEAKLEKCDEIAVAETGFLKGHICTENAEVSGRFEGDLVVRKRLLIRAKGHVTGTITYGELEVERGGKVVGTAEARESARQTGGW
jgi:cytoskeletal protein CcmA (bactofilin family)